MAYRESDQLVLLYEIEEGADRIRSLQRKHLPGKQDWRNKCKPHCRE